MKHGLSPIETKILGLLEFEAESPLHIGIGGEEVVRDLIRLPTEDLVIPSSTWKGTFRFMSEQVAKQTGFKGLSGLAVRLYSEEAGISYRGSSEDLKEEFEGFTREFIRVIQGGISDIIPDGASGLKLLMMKLGYTEDEIKEVEANGLNARRSSPQNMAEAYIALHCPIGRLYGNMVTAGKIRFIDTMIRRNIEVRPGVGIDRKSGKAKEGMLQFINIISKGPIRLRMVLDNLMPGDDDSKIFASTLNTIKIISVSIGARKSAGLGALKISKGEFYVFNLTDDKNSGEFIIGNPLKKVKPIGLEEFIRWLGTGV